MDPNPFPHHTLAVGLDGLPNITLFYNHVATPYGFQPRWGYTQFIDAYGTTIWEAQLIAPPINPNAAGRIQYGGRGVRKSYAKDAAAHAYLTANQVVLPPPLAPLNY